MRRLVLVTVAVALVAGGGCRRHKAEQKEAAPLTVQDVAAKVDELRAKSGSEAAESFLQKLVEEGGSAVQPDVVGMLLNEYINAGKLSAAQDEYLKLAAKEYPAVTPVGSASIHRSIYYTVKASLVFLLLFLLTLPLIFVPLFGQIWMLWLWSILLKEPTVYDVGSLFIPDPKELKQRGKKAGLIALVAATFNYLPFLSIFAPLFAQILFLHYILGSEELGSRN